MKKNQDTQKKKADVSINLDNTPILYTDRIGITTNPDGVVLDIMQRIGPTKKARIVARVGMSREHAGKFVQELGRLLTINQNQKQKPKKVN